MTKPVCSMAYKTKSMTKEKEATHKITGSSKIKNKKIILKQLQARTQLF